MRFRLWGEETTVKYFLKTRLGVLPLRIGMSRTFLSSYGNAGWS